MADHQRLTAATYVEAQPQTTEAKLMSELDAMQARAVKAEAALTVVGAEIEYLRNAMAKLVGWVREQEGQ